MTGQMRTATTIARVTEPGLDGQGGVLCSWDVPGVGTHAPVPVVARAGHSTVVVGANGSGKSALGVWMEQHSGGFSGIRRLIAHRKLWFQFAGPGVTVAQHEATRNSMAQWSRQHESRYLDHADGQRASMVLFDILARVNYEYAQMITMYRAG